MAQWILETTDIQQNCILLKCNNDSKALTVKNWENCRTKSFAPFPYSKHVPTILISKMDQMNLI